MADLAQVEPAVIEAQNGLVFTVLFFLDFLLLKNVFILGWLHLGQVYVRTQRMFV